MKKTFFTSILLLSLIACSSDSDSSNSTAVFKANIDGVLFEPDMSSATVIDGETNDVINIIGMDANGKTITLTNSDIETGIHSLEFQNASQGSALAYKVDSNANDSFVAGFTVANSAGFINVIEIDYDNNLISGTFEAFAQSGTIGNVDITDGIFTNIPFETDQPTVGNNSFFAEVDGVEFNETSINGLEVSLAGNTTISIVASISVDESIGLTIPMENSSPGTYDFDFLPSAGSFVGNYNVNNSSYSAVNGSITITTHDTVSKRIEGSFFFNAEPFTSTTPSFEITNGTFSVDYL